MSLSDVEQASVVEESVSRPERVRQVLRKGIEDAVVPGACVLASVGSDTILSVVEGTKSFDSEGVGADQLRSDTVFDLGRLTQSLCTATLLMCLASTKKIAPSDRAARYLQALGLGQKSKITLAHLLAHTAGFPAGVSVYEELVKANAGPRPGILASSGAKQYAYSHFHNLPLRFEPGTRELQSEVNYLILGEICEIVTGLPLERAFARYVTNPLQLRSLTFIDLTILRRRRLEPMVELFAPMGSCSRRGRVIAGEVWDDNAWVMGGISGHAGLFGTVEDVHVLAQAILDGVHGRSELIAPDVARSFLGYESAVGGQSGPFGFSVPTKEDGFIAEKNAPHARVAVSGTGSSVYIDCERETVIVFLGGAATSAQSIRKLNSLRAEVHTAIVE